MTSCKRLSIVFVILALLLSIITGCGIAGSPIDQTSSQNPQTANMGLIPTTENSRSSVAVNGQLKVSFLDVGQADCILIQTPQEQAVLIDGGNNDDGPGVVSYLKKQGIQKLAAVIATHPHEDHIGGLDTVIKAFPVDAVYLPNVSTTTRTFRDFIAAVNKSGAAKIQAKAGVKCEIPGLDAVFLAPNSTKYEDLNNYSTVLKLTYGKTAFLFTGDAQEQAEKEMLASGSLLKADVLKVGHHGSQTSTNPAFLKAVSPKYAVISVGKDNDFGHPHEKTLNKLAKAGVQIFRTDKDGTIVITSDGEQIHAGK